MSELKFYNESKQGFPVIFRGKEADVLFRAGSREPYVVASGYDPEIGEWSQGTYTDDLNEAMALANGFGCGWHSNPGSLREVAEGIVGDDCPASAHKRYEVARIEWYVLCYENDLDDAIERIETTCGLSWRDLSDFERTSLLAHAAHCHSAADWSLISEDADFYGRFEKVLENDIARDVERAMGR